MRRHVERHVWRRAASTGADRMAGSLSSDRAPSDRPPLHHRFRERQPGQVAHVVSLRHRPSTLRHIDGRTDVFQRVQHAQERRDRQDFRIVGVRTNVDRCGDVLTRSLKCRRSIERYRRFQIPRHVVVEERARVRGFHDRRAVELLELEMSEGGGRSSGLPNEPKIVRSCPNPPSRGRFSASANGISFDVRSDPDVEPSSTAVDIRESRSLSVE